MQYSCDYLFFLIHSGTNETWIEEEGFEQEPDDFLKDGQELPEFYGTFPKKFYHCPLKDLDNYYTQRGLEVLLVFQHRKNMQLSC